MQKRISYALIGAILGAAVFSGHVHAADNKVAKTDCSVKKNANKVECKKAPAPKKEVKAKKPEKVERKAPKSVQQKAAENDKK